MGAKVLVLAEKGVKEEKHCGDLNASGAGLEGVCIPYRCMAHKEHGAKSGGGKREEILASMLH